MNINERYSVSNTNASRAQAVIGNFVRVYDRGELVAEVEVSSRDPLQYLRRHPGSAYRAELVRQLNRARVPESVQEWILA